jgi:hypothetical protein
LGPWPPNYSVGFEPLSFFAELAGTRNGANPAATPRDSESGVPLIIFFLLFLHDSWPSSAFIAMITIDGRFSASIDPNPKESPKNLPSQSITRIPVGSRSAAS